MFKKHEISVPLSVEEIVARISNNTERKWLNSKTWDCCTKPFEGQVEGCQFKFYVNAARSFCRVGRVLLIGEVHQGVGATGSKVSFTTRFDKYYMGFQAFLIGAMLFGVIDALLSGGDVLEAFGTVIIVLTLISLISICGFRSKEAQSLTALRKALDV